MAAVSVTCTKVVQDANGRIRVRFGKREKEFQDLATLKAFVSDKLDLDTLEAIALRIIIDRAPNNPQAAEGHTLTVDTSQNAWGTLT